MSRVNVSNTRAQSLCARSYRLVAQGARVVVPPPVSSTASCARGWPPTVAKFPIAASREPSGDTSNRLMLVLPPPSLFGS